MNCLYCARVAEMAQKQPKQMQFAIVRWVEEESVGVMPLTAMHKGQTVHVGTYCEMKFKSNNEVEILKIDGKSC